MKVRFTKLAKNAVMPKKAHPTDAGFDLVATSRVFDKYGCVTYGTGLAVEIPKGYVGLLFPRSSICKQDLLQTNSVGIIDSSYRGELFEKYRPALTFIDKDGVNPIKATEPWQHEGTDQTDPDTQLVSFHGRSEKYPDIGEGCLPFQPRVYEVGDRIAQLVIIPYPEIEFEEAGELSESDRGTGGFGSTGR